LNSQLRVALFTDSYLETNGVGTYCREYASVAKQQGIPFFVAYGGTESRLRTGGSLTELELRRGPASFGVDADLRCDPCLTRHRDRAVAALKEFRPNLIHITGPGDVSILGMWAASLVGVPVVASWHTNVHDYAYRRLQSSLSFLPAGLRESVSGSAYRGTLWATMRFYSLAHFVAAPNKPMVDLLANRTHRPAFLIPHGVNTELFVPDRRNRTDSKFCIGYVGRLTPEKNVRYLAELEQRLVDAGADDFRLSIVGEGSEREWLETHVKRAHFTGVLRGKTLATEFANMDAFVFPSLTDTFGLVILEAMAAGVPVVVSPETGARAGVINGVSGFLSNDFAASLIELMRSPESRRRMGVEARIHACDCTWTGVFEDLYRTFKEGLHTEEVQRRWRTPRFAPVSGTH